MKPRNREITIFNLSMLDVISGAVGAFLIITVVLFPSYAKNVLIGQKDLEEFRKIKEELTAELERVEQEPRVDVRRVESRNQHLKQALAKVRQKEETEPAVQSNLGPVLVAAFGGLTYDIAVSVLPERPGVPEFDAGSKEPWRDPSHYAGTPPGVVDKRYNFEVIPTPRLLLVPRPIPGVRYRIYYTLTRSAQNEEHTVRGQLSYGEHTWKLPLPKVVPGRGAFAGSFEFDDDGALFFTAPNDSMQKAFENLNRFLLNRRANERRKAEQAKNPAK